MQRVFSVEPGGIAYRYGVKPGDEIESVNGEKLIDEIDYQALTSRRRVTLLIRKPDGTCKEVDILKPTHAPLGLQFDKPLIGDPRSCANHCIFCFIDQMPSGMRETLYVKDDDWRMSLMMGNYVTLTNVSDREFERIIRRKASPLYISVHATDPAVRVAMMRQKLAVNLMPRLRRLKQEELTFHCQIVLCPGVNDGTVLEQTLQDLLDLSPAAVSAALVPVGLTKFREDLPQIAPYTKEQAQQVLDIAVRFQKIAMQKTGSRFVFPADELLCIAQADLPDADYYEGYPQIENGVGMIRMMEDQLREAAMLTPHQFKPGSATPRIAVACGTSIFPYITRWTKEFAAGRPVTVHPVENSFFGDTVTVSGLVVGQDLVRQLHGVPADLVLLPDSMLSHDGEHFLDNMTLPEVERAVGIPLRTIPVTGQAMYDALNAPHLLMKSPDHEKESQDAHV